MSNLLRRTIALALVLALTASPAMAQSATVAPGAIQTLGCYASADTLTEFGDSVGQSSGYCRDNCTQLASPAPVMAITGGVTCYCGDELPALDQLVSDDKCNVKCMGYGVDDCGGMGYYQLYLTGLGANVHTAPNSSTSASAGSSSTQPAIVTRPGETVFVTPTASSDEPQPSSSSGPNKVGIAVGVVVGVLALAGIIGIVVFVVKRKRNREIEEEHRRNAANSFLSGKSDKSSPDQRLDPSINIHGRQSIGSIADERDFSRRILQVRNPDRDSVRSTMA
ncbi:uncharacterized protein A1O9_00821 [Exophiala aquamarina CBS 119918]|uniref:WSC domain-containing protein n=1 Tax=Exophiala aquamarina CBS 119918 TaxID=1182545 RepID=A0A072PU44_9EURO|nr:uncharacterized protein A1O9_00821 [Exophiala aquamarina CBS 119918]KEF62848.1 hypothetical protein A1O9_00821 [Exophiala aquamarina CBS 119918]